MTTKERLHIHGHVAKTRMPFRVAAVLLGILFIAFGLYQLLGGATDWVAFGFAIFVALTGLQFVYSAFTEQWKFPLEWPRREKAGQTPERFLIVEPVSRDIRETEISCQSSSPKHAINPYAPPRDAPTTSVAQGKLTQRQTLQTLTQQFLDGNPFIHYGVVFFLDSNDDVVIHAALPLSSSSDLLACRNTNEAIRVLPKFLSSLPNASQAVTGRNLVVRMISSYDRLDDEVSNRIVVPWARIRTGSGEPADARESPS